MEGYLARMANRIEHDPPEALVGLEGRYQQYCQQVRRAGRLAAAQLEPA